MVDSTRPLGVSEVGAVVVEDDLLDDPFDGQRGVVGGSMPEICT